MQKFHTSVKADIYSLGMAIYCMMNKNTLTDKNLLKEAYFNKVFVFDDNFESKLIVSLLGNLNS